MHHGTAHPRGEGGVCRRQGRSSGKAGDVAGTLDEINAVLTRFGASQEVVDQNFGNMTVQAQMFATNLQSALGERAAPAMERMGALWMRLNENLDAGKYDAFISMMADGFELVGSAVAWAADNMNVLFPLAGSLLMGLAAYQLVMKTGAGIVTAYGVVMKAYAAARVRATVAEAASTPITWAAVGPYVALAAAVLAVGAALLWALGKSKDFYKEIGRLGAAAGLGKDAAYQKMETALKGTAVPAEIPNTDPISVQGTVAIERED